MNARHRGTCAALVEDELIRVSYRCMFNDLHPHLATRDGIHGDNISFRFLIFAIRSAKLLISVGAPTKDSFILERVAVYLRLIWAHSQTR